MTVAILGGTGLSALGVPDASATTPVQTPFGPTSAPLQRLATEAGSVTFLARHGNPHAIAPHAVNYRANLWALKEAGASQILATYAVGGIAPDLAVGDLVIPDQIVDYTWGRQHSYDDELGLKHYDFSYPFDRDMSDRLVAACADLDIRHHANGTYGVTQGPRLETAAEIDRMDRDGCTVVGMTAMPEAGLARELDLPYAGVCFVVNPAAGRSTGLIGGAELSAAVRDGTQTLLRVLARSIQGLD